MLNHNGSGKVDAKYAVAFLIPKNKMRNNLISRAETSELKERLIAAGFAANGKKKFREEYLSFSKNIFASDDTLLYVVTCFLYDMRDVTVDENESVGVEWSVCNMSKNIPIERLEMNIVDDCLQPRMILELAEKFILAMYAATESIKKSKSL